jgi:hypothetical protein
VNDWRTTVERGARSLYFAPLVALALAPVAVFFRAALVVLALWHGYCVWRFTAGDAQSVTPRLGHWRWALRTLALAGAVLITLDYEAYRALLIATVAAYLAYLSELLPTLGLSPPKALRPAALGALLCCALVAGELMLRRSVSSAGWGTTPGNCLSALAVPLGLLAWFQVARVRTPDLEAEPNAAPAAYASPIRAWARKVREVVIPFGIAFSLGVGVVLISFVGGATIAFIYADLDPGVIRAAASFCLLCVDGWLLLALRKCKRQTLRRTVVATGLTHVPLWWFLVFPTQFQSGAWKRSPVGSETRSDMAEDLIYSRVLLGKTHTEVVELVGPSRGYGTPPNVEHYSLGDRPCRGFEIEFHGETVSQAYFWLCD